MPWRAALGALRRRVRRRVHLEGIRSSGTIALAFVLLAIAALGCDEPEPMLLGPSATWLVSSPPTAAGQPFELVLFVRTPEGHRAHAYVVPPLDGMDVVERRILPPIRKGAVEVHREVLLARPRSTGLHRWPPSEVQVTDASGETHALALDGLEFDVPSVLGEGAPPRRPRGYRPAPAAPTATGFGIGFVAGSGAACAAALLVLRRRRGAAGRRERAPSAGVAVPGRSHFGGSGRLRRRLEAAREALPEEPEQAAAEAALALRHWAADRFLFATHALAPEELRRACPEHTEAPEWRAWTERLAALESARWAGREAQHDPAALGDAIDRALAFAERIDGRARDKGPQARAGETETETEVDDRREGDVR